MALVFYFIIYHHCAYTTWIQSCLFSRGFALLSIQAAYTFTNDTGYQIRREEENLTQEVIENPTRRTKRRGRGEALKTLSAEAQNNEKVKITDSKRERGILQAMMKEEAEKDPDTAMDIVCRVVCESSNLCDMGYPIKKINIVKL